MVIVLIFPLSRALLLYEVKICALIGIVHYKIPIFVINVYQFFNWISCAPFQFQLLAIFRLLPNLESIEGAIIWYFGIWAWKDSFLGPCCCLGPSVQSKLVRFYFELLSCHLLIQGLLFTPNHQHWRLLTRYKQFHVCFIFHRSTSKSNYMGQFFIIVLGIRF